MNFSFIALCIAAVLVYIAIAGFIICKAGYAKTWIKGIITFVHWFYDDWARIIRALVGGLRKIYLWITRDDLALYQRDNSLLLLSEEISQLLNLLNGRPYNFPTFDGCSVDSADIYYLNISAFGLTHDYKELTAEQILQVSQRIVSEFWRTTRGLVPPFYISEATENRLTVLIPLSEYGRQILQQRAEQVEALRRLQRQAMTPVSNQLIENVDIPSFDDGDEL